VAWTAVAMPPAIVSRQDPVEGGEQVGIGAGAELHDHQPRGCVGNEHREQTVAPVRRPGSKPRALGGEVVEAGGGAGPDGDLRGVYGNMLRTASRSRPNTPAAGADS
jgi:hypothetical protein